MHELESIRKLYAPFHPVRNLKSNTLSYTEFLPHRSLQPYIFHYWEMKSRGKLEKAIEHKLVPNGCIDLYFEISHPDRLFVTGLSNKHSSVNVSEEFHFVGICFVPTIAPQLYRVNASDLQNRHELLADVAPSTAHHIKSAFYPGLTLRQINELLDKHFIREISRLKLRHDPRLLQALHDIFVSGGQVRVESGLDVGLSVRQLRRVFDTYVGDSPKSFARTIRFQKCLQANAFDPGAEKSFYDFGYYDQVHYIKEFKRLYGTTPTRVAPPVTMSDFYYRD